MKFMKKSLLALSLLTISANVLPDGGLGDVIRAPFVFTGDVVEGTGDVVTGRNPVKARDIRAQKSSLKAQYKNGNITKAQYNQRLKELNQQER